MHIYISPANEKKLREYNGSMSGLINRLLQTYFEGADTPVARSIDTLAPSLIKDLVKARSTQNWCKEHDMNKEHCKLMKHKGGK